MTIRKTEELDQILMKTSMKDYKDYLKKENILPGSSIQNYFNAYIAAHHLSTSELVRKSRLSREYAYHILSGAKPNPGRDKVLALAIAAGMSYEEIQRALEISHNGILYPRDGRDAAIIVCLYNGVKSVDEINYFLEENGYPFIR